MLSWVTILQSYTIYLKNEGHYRHNINQYYLYEIVQVAQFLHVGDAVWLDDILKDFTQVVRRFCERKGR